MSEPCKLIKELHRQLLEGANPDDIFPLHLEGFNPEQLIEIYSWGSKYLQDVDRVELCKRKLREVR